ncbi:UNVERIFIED_CONTAM: hypothetical protein RMT77_018112 [Armadillidium vulgare]
MNSVMKMSLLQIMFWSFGETQLLPGILCPIACPLPTNCPTLPPCPTCPPPVNSISLAEECANRGALFCKENNKCFTTRFRTTTDDRFARQLCAEFNFMFENKNFSFHLPYLNDIPPEAYSCLGAIVPASTVTPFQPFHIEVDGDLGSGNCRELNVSSIDGRTINEVKESSECTEGLPFFCVGSFE